MQENIHCKGGIKDGCQNLGKLQYLKAVPSKIQSFQTKQFGGNFVNVNGSSGWHFVTIEQIKKFKMAFRMAARIMAKVITMQIFMFWHFEHMKSVQLIPCKECI